MNNLRRYGLCFTLGLTSVFAIPIVFESVQKESNFEIGAPDFIDEVVKQNVIDVVAEITQRSTILADLVSNEETAIDNGVYFVETREVVFT
jgi:carbonic anhydrase